MAGATLVEAVACTLVAVDFTGAAPSTAVDTAPAIAADTMADFTVRITAAPMAATDPTPAKALLTTVCTADTAVPTPLLQHVRGHGKATPLETFRPDGISSIPVAQAIALTPHLQQ